MKINSITTNKAYLKGRASEASPERQRECAKERYELQQNNNDQINTTIKRDSDGRVSFKGKDPSTWLHNVAHFAGDKPLLAEALFAILITCGARPITIMATAKTEEDKEKCQYQVAKSISSGILGLAATALINPPISKATKAMEKSGAFNKIPEYAAKLISNFKGEKVAKASGNYAKTSKNVMDKLLQPIFMPLRAKLTIMAVPVILGALGLKKSSKKAIENSKVNTNYNMFQNADEKVLFKAFSTTDKNPQLLDSLKTEKNTEQKLNSDNQEKKTEKKGILKPLLLGALGVGAATLMIPKCSNKASKLLSQKLYPSVANSKPFQWIASQLSKTDKSFTALLVGESFLLSGFYMFNTAKNKKIKKEQKPQMLINDAMTWAFSTAGALTLEGRISDFVSKGTEKYIANRKSFYRDLAGKNGIETHLSDLVEQVKTVAGKTGLDRVQGAEAVSETIGNHLKDLVGNKTFQISKQKLSEVQASVKGVITSPDASKDLVEKVQSQVKALYSDLAGRLEADKFEAGMKKVKTLVIFGIIYRYLGPVLITPMANKLSSKLFGKNKKADSVNKK